jgi:hypothetical protein
MDCNGDGGVERRRDALLAIAGRMGWVDIAARLQADRTLLGVRRCRIVVVGEAGTGKTTLINRAFLKEDLLPADGGTIVPTEIRHGPERRMEVYPYLERPARCAGHVVGGAAGIDPALLACEGPPSVIADPPPAEIRRHVAEAASTPRHRRTGATARVCLFLPEPVLEGLVLVDTPGIRPLSRAAVSTRYRIIPAGDRVLFTARRLRRTSAELALLESPVLEGREPCLLPPGAAWSNRREALAPEGPQPAIREASERMLIFQAELARARCSVELRLLGMPLDTRRRIEGEFDALEAEIRSRQPELLSALADDLAALAADLSDTCGREIAATARHAGRMTGTGFAPAGLCRDLEGIAAGCGRNMMTAARTLAEGYGGDARSLLSPWEAWVRRTIGPETVPGRPTPFSVLAMDMIAAARPNPFGILADILPGIAAPAPPACRRRMIIAAMPGRIETILRPLAETIPAAWEDAVNSRVGAVRQGIAGALGRAGDPERRALLTATLRALEEMAFSSPGA